MRISSICNAKIYYCFIKKKKLLIKHNSFALIKTGFVAQQKSIYFWVSLGTPQKKWHQGLYVIYVKKNENEDEISSKSDVLKGA